MIGALERARFRGGRCAQNTAILQIRAYTSDTCLFGVRIACRICFTSRFGALWVPDRFRGVEFRMLECRHNGASRGRLSPKP